MYRQQAIAALAAKAKPIVGQGEEMYKLTVALSKGRLADKAIGLLTACGIDCSPLLIETRELVLFDKSHEFRFVFVKPSDVPTYIERGVADIGFVGKDTVMEENKDIFEMLDLGFGACKLCIAGYPDKKVRATDHNLIVATKYCNIAKRYYDNLGVNVDIIKLNGSIELAPILELSDVILDIVESGKTLVANGLVVLEDLYPISARLVVNKVSLKTKGDIILPLIEKLKSKLNELD